MKFKQKQTNLIALLVISISAIITFAMGVSFAVFYDSKIISNTSIMGKVELTANNSAEFSYSGSVVPGQSISASDIACSASENATDMYVRVGYNVSTTSSNQNVIDWVNNELMNKINLGNGITSGANYQWIKQDDGYFYLFNRQEVPTLLSINYNSVSNPTYVFLQNGILIPENVEPAENNAQYGASLNFNIIFQAIQGRNLPQTDITSIKNYFNDSF